MAGLAVVIVSYGAAAAAQNQKARIKDRPLDTHAMLAAIGNLYGIDPNLLAAIARVESDWQINAVSPAGAIGLMQLMPATAKRFDANPYDPIDNVLGAARYIDALKRRYHSSPDALVKTLAAYNAGSGAVEHYDGIPPYAETRAYVRRVLWLYLTGTMPAAPDTVVESPAHASQTTVVKHVAHRASATIDVRILDQLQNLQRQRAQAVSQ
ncbi:MAG: lytic transglycosylase domain-containing protein [Candidatus Binataceae bacterium]